jgi:hypothetical protein
VWILDADIQEHQCYVTANRVLGILVRCPRGHNKSRRPQAAVAEWPSAGSCFSSSSLQKLQRTFAEQPPGKAEGRKAGESDQRVRAGCVRQLGRSLRLYVRLLWRSRLGGWRLRRIILSDLGLKFGHRRGLFHRGFRSGLLRLLWLGRRPGRRVATARAAVLDSVALVSKALRCLGSGNFLPEIVTGIKPRA